MSNILDYLKRMTWVHLVLCCFYAVLGTNLSLCLIKNIGLALGWSNPFGSSVSFSSELGALLLFVIFGFNLIFLDGRFGPIWPELKSELK